MIHTFGDSHGKFGWEKCHGVFIHEFPCTLCYSFGRDKLNRCNISDYNLQPNDTVVFSWGEIDCRCHVSKHITIKKTYKHIIRDIVDKYIIAIQENVKNCPIRLKNVCVYNIPPPIKKEESFEDNKYLPFRATDIQRKLSALYFNRCLKQACIDNNYIFVDVYDLYTDKDGFLQLSMSDHNIHIDNSIHIQSFINKHLL
tara:strand:+ start:3737 stop:4333 length:597 start_codon:yes stop_codon:yes gene_type:complete